MLPTKIIVRRPEQKGAKTQDELLRRVAGALRAVARHGRGHAAALHRVPFIHAALRKASEITDKIPLLAAFRRNLSRKDVAFIAAAYAIPLPGTALCAAALVGSRLGCRYLLNRFKPRLTIAASNG